MPPQGPQGLQQGPTSPPPATIPQQPAAAAFAVDPGAISRCLFRYTYIWTRGGFNFWFFPTFVGRTSVSGFRWTGRTWVFSGLSLNSIVSFTCV
ncbi:transporter [Gorillibacterium sp. sgz500922]|uniref:transporter n=1 Tax=Gorillibacterium sp. sgz500922 TaxID=3446694 RepID=UPI003F67BEDB